MVFYLSSVKRGNGIEKVTGNLSTLSVRWTLCWRKSGRKKDWRGGQNRSFDDFCPLSCTDGMNCTKMYFARAARFFPSFNTLSTWPSLLPLSVSFLDPFNIHWHYLVALFSQPMLFFILAISSSIFRTNRRISAHIFQSITFHLRCFFFLFFQCRDSPVAFLLTNERISCQFSPISCAQHYSEMRGLVWQWSFESVFRRAIFLERQKYRVFSRSVCSRRAKHCESIGKQLLY